MTGRKIRLLAWRVYGRTCAFMVWRVSAFVACFYFVMVLFVCLPACLFLLLRVFLSSRLSTLACSSVAGLDGGFDETLSPIPHYVGEVLRQCHAGSFKLPTESGGVCRGAPCAFSTFYNLGDE